MGAVKTNHKRNAQPRWIKRVLKQWDREDQAAEAAEVRRHNRAVKAHKLKRLYPNSIAPERNKITLHIDHVNGFSLKNQNGVVRMKLTRNGPEYFNDRGKLIGGIDLASGKDQTDYTRNDRTQRVGEGRRMTEMERFERDGQACIDGLREGIKQGREHPYLIGIDLASGKDQTGYGGRIE